MKFPKLKHTVLCQILLYAPGIIPFLLLIAAPFLPSDWAGIAVGIALLGMVFFIWYLLHNMVLLISSEALFTWIRQWQLDRTEYLLPDGDNREKLHQKLRRRCALWGKRFQSANGRNDVEVFYRHGVSQTIFWSAIEKKIAVCEVSGTLTAGQYRLVTARAREMFSQIPDGKIRFRTKSEKKAPRARADVILILADTVDDEVKKEARMMPAKDENHVIRPCVIQCSYGCCYTDCTKEYYEAGMMPRPVGNYAAAMIRRIVFSRRIPKENRESQPRADIRYDVEMSLWEYLRTARRSIDEGTDEQEREREKAWDQMKNGEVRIHENIIWYKDDGRLAEYLFLPEEDNEKSGTLISDQIWYYRKYNDFLAVRIFRLTGLNRRKMKAAEAERVRKTMESKLIAEGYQIIEE